MVMLKVQYLSSNIDNKDQIYKEFRDIYPIIAMNLKLEGYTHVGLEALPILLLRFGYAEYQTHRHNMPVKNLFDYREKVMKEKL